MTAEAILAAIQKAANEYWKQGAPEGFGSPEQAYLEWVTPEELAEAIAKHLAA